LRQRIQRQAARGSQAVRAGHPLEQARTLAKYRQRRRDAERVGQTEPMQRRAQQGDIAEFRIADHGGQLEPCGAHLPQQRQRLSPFLLKDDRGGNLRSLPRIDRQPTLWQIQRRAEEPCAPTGPQRDGRRHLAIGDLAQRPTVLTGHAHRVRSLFRKAGAIEDQDTASFGHDRAQPAPHAFGVPRRVGNEMLKGLIGDRLGDPCQHRLHRLAVAVAEDALDVGPQRHQLRPMAKAALELLEPAHQSLNARRGRVVDHRVARYQTIWKSTMSSIQITRETRTNQGI
jgi:hypothetical protein